MGTVVTMIISILALLISFISFWYSFINKGKLKMTQPCVVFIGPDGTSSNRKHIKVFFRALLYSTAKKGQVLESLYITVQRDEAIQNFSIWVYGDKRNLKRGSGLFIPQEGLVFDHHFLMVKEKDEYIIRSGSYNIKIYAKQAGRGKTILLYSVVIQISEKEEDELRKTNNGIYFDWCPELQQYKSHIEDKQLSNNEVVGLFRKLIE